MGDGEITLREMKNGIERMIEDENLSISSLNDLLLLQVMERFDDNGEGVVSPQELENFCKKEFKNFVPNEVKYKIFELQNDGGEPGKDSKHSRRRSSLVQYMIENENFVDPFGSSFN